MRRAGLCVSMVEVDDVYEIGKPASPLDEAKNSLDRNKQENSCGYGRSIRDFIPQEKSKKRDNQQNQIHDDVTKDYKAVEGTEPI
jgi:hypothetical protein